jgi:hypothetical protein
MNKNTLIQESKSILSESDTNWLLSDYKTNPLHNKAVPFFDTTNILKYPYIILTQASEDGAAIPLLFATKEDAEAYREQKHKEGVTFNGPFKLTSP